MEENIAEKEAGVVTQAKGYLISLEGLPSARINDIIINAHGQRALVTALNEGGVEALLLDPGSPGSGERFVTHSEGIQLYLGDALFGRAINVLGDPIDGLGDLPPRTEPLCLEGDAPDMSARELMVEQLVLGMTVVDILLPIAKGQRQLVIGPNSSGKDIFLESVAAAQKDTDVVCVYALIGRPTAYIENVIAHLHRKDGNTGAVVIAARSDEPAPLVSIAPAVALQVAESFSKKGKDVLLILDDLAIHAKYFREIALLSGRVPGRESYPGDTFYAQAHLLERAGFFNKAHGGGSLTLLPVLETNIEEMTNLISTNLMSATDGHLFFSPVAHAEGYFPATEPRQSVTRVGRQTQSTLAKQLSTRVLSLLSDYEREKRYSQFGAQLSLEAQKTLLRGEIVNVFLRQEPMAAVSSEEQIMLLALVFTSFVEKKDAELIKGKRTALSGVIAKDPSLQPLVDAARKGTVTLDAFLKKLEVSLASFETVCRP